MILFNHKYRIVGYVFLMPAIGILIAKNVFKQSLDFLYLPVFAIQSTFTETKYFFGCILILATRFSLFFQ